ncbi:MAG: hypothetical protein HFP81_01380 [Methylococcales symbiont of Hymedesmia sp. n. MRB-2018]|nr:MAG: hypothetical protein HFP78_03450 [Methylococcales symbiont of Hymedesmia sp. n. MRB-2018]KAF3984594.1 MAG: hypothetical protein HFP81_01380 [Methylococcales symbiont of Hymedesmia sp. n. MRB-2018]
MNSRGITLEELPIKNKSDYIHDATKAGLNLIPLVGGATAGVFETIFSAPIDKRKEEWLKRLSKTVDQLCQTVNGLTEKKLSNNPEFISIYLQASNIAIRTHNEEKLRALNAAVKNSVLIESLDESKKMIFLRIVDQMTLLHFKVLHFLSDPEKYIQDLNSRQPANQKTYWRDIRNVWDESFTDVRSNNPLIDLSISDLKNWGLIYIGKFHEASLQSVQTQIGQEFLGFINDRT